MAESYLIWFISLSPKSEPPIQQQPDELWFPQNECNLHIINSLQRNLRFNKNIVKPDLQNNLLDNKHRFLSTITVPQINKACRGSTQRQLQWRQTMK